MQLESYFDFLGPNDIRIKGHRIGIESVLYEYIYNEKTPAELVERFPTLSLEQVHATILYYLHNRPQIDQYIQAWLEYGDRMREEQAQNPPPIVLKLQQARADSKLSHANT